MAVHRDIFDHDRRRWSVALQLRWIDHEQAPDGRKPECSIAHLPDCRLHARFALDGSKTIQRAVWRACELLNLAARELPEVVSINGENAFARCHPEAILAVPGDAVDLVVEQAVTHEIAEDLTVVEQAQPRSQSPHPQQAVLIDKERVDFAYRCVRRRKLAEGAILIDPHAGFRCGKNMSRAIFSPGNCGETGSIFRPRELAIHEHRQARACSYPERAAAVTEQKLDMIGG